MTDDPALSHQHGQGRLLECGKVAVGGILDQKAVKATVIGLAHAGLHADFGGHTGKQQRLDAAGTQPLLHIRGMEHALAGLVDDPLACQRTEGCNDLIAGLAAQSDRSGRCGSRVWMICHPCRRASASRRSTVGTMACNVLTSLPSAAPKPPGSRKSRCMSMITSAVRPGSQTNSPGVAAIL